MSMQLSINDVLCEDMLHYIFSFLPKPALLHCSETCRKWRELISEKHHWIALANQLGIPSSDHENLRIEVGKVLKKAKEVIHSINRDYSWQFEFKYNGKTMVVNFPQNSDILNQKLSQAFTGYLLFHLVDEKQAYEIACRLGKEAEIKKALERLIEVYFSKGNMEGAIQVALSLPGQSDEEQAALLVKIVEYLCQHNQRQQAKDVHQMIPYACEEERNRAAAMMAEGG